MSAGVVAWAAALAVWLLVPARETRLDARHEVRVPGWLAGRPGAPRLEHRAALGATAGLLAGTLLGGVVGIVVAALVTAGVLVGLGRMGGRDETGRLRAEQPDALDFLAACLEVGLPMSRAVAVVVEVSPPATARVLAVVDAALQVGRAGDEAWLQLSGHPVWGRTATDVAGSERRGTSLVGLLRAHADDVRQDEAEAVLKRARTVGVRSVLPLMVCFLPAFVLVGVVPIVAGLVRDLLG